MTTLEKIRAEQAELFNASGIGNTFICYKALQIIDKYAEQECEDAVSIDVIIEWLKSKDIIKMSNQEKNARKELQALFSVQPKHETGHWIIDKGSLDAFYGEVCKCSECGVESIGESDYCPNCGAKMVEPQESEETLDKYQYAGMSKEEFEHFEKLAKYYNGEEVKCP